MSNYENCRFRKIICGLGHSSGVFSENEPLPRKCPVCGQPYDRKYNRPVYCMEDGTVPSEREESEIRREQPELRREQPEIRREQSELRREQSEIRRGQPEIYRGQPEMQPIRRNGFERRNTANIYEEPSYEEPAMAPRRRRTEFAEDLRGRHTETADSSPYVSSPGRNIYQNTGRNARLFLYCGGVKIPVPVEGAYLGRDMLGAECMKMNRLVSRKHAYVMDNQFGSLQIRDAGSLNGTYVDDGTGRRKLESGENVELKAGSKIWLADQIFIVEEDG